MMRILLILAAICAAVLAGLALTRGEPHPQMIAAPVEPERAPAVEEAAKPAAATVPAAPQPVAPAKVEPVDPQIADDAAAVGMTTRQPPAEEPAASEAPKEKK